MTNEPSIMSEWQWLPAARPSPQHAVYDQLVWHGMILGAVEAFRETGPFYGNIGTGRSPLDYRYRTGPVGDLDSCRKRVEENVLRSLNEAFGGTDVRREAAGWLIEMNDPPVYHLLSADYDEQWTGDVSRAVRFAREEDAQAYVDHVGWTTPPVRVVEHMWSGRVVLSGPKSAGAAAAPIETGDAEVALGPSEPSPPSETAAVGEDTTIGGITWHCSEEDSGPDVGISVYLGPNDRLWCGEISRRLFDEQDGPAHFVSDGGAFIVRFNGKDTTLIAKCADLDTGREFAEQIAAWIRGVDGGRSR